MPFNYELKFKKHFLIRAKERGFKFTKEEFKQSFLSSLKEMYSAKDNSFKVRTSGGIVVFKFEDKNTIILITIIKDLLLDFRNYLNKKIGKIKSTL